jgi:hypothetical protein
LAGICAKIGSHSPRQTKWRELAVLTFAGLGLCSTVSPGIVQLGIGFLAILFFWLWRGESKEISKALAFKFIAAGAIASVPFFLYGIHTCTTQHADVVNSFFRGNTLEIFKSILFVLIPVSTVQSSSLTLIFFLGLVGPFVLFRTDVKNSRTWQSFSWVVLTQIGAGILLGGILAFRDYYFVPKLFSYFLTCRAFGIAVGLSILLRMASKAGDQVRLSGRVRTGLGVACVAGVLALAGLKHQRRFALILSQTDPLITSTEACPKLRGKVEFWTVPQADMGFANCSAVAGRILLAGLMSPRRESSLTGNFRILYNMARRSPEQVRSCT